MQQKLNIWTIYENTKDFPGKFVARRFELDQPTRDHFVGASAEAVRDWVQEEAAKMGQGAPYRLPRQPEDDTVILESWV